MRLRSARRPPASDPLAPGTEPGPDGATPASADPPGAIVERDGSEIRRIDLDQLRRSVAGLGQTARQRGGIAEGMQPVLEPLPDEPMEPDDDAGRVEPAEADPGPRTPQPETVDADPGVTPSRAGTLRAALSRFLPRG